MERLLSIVPLSRRGFNARFMRRGKRQGLEVLEAAMASSISQAREGSLYLNDWRVKSPVFESNKKLLEDLSVNLRYCGEAGKAAEVKALGEYGDEY